MTKKPQTPFEKFRSLAGRLSRVPKAEADQKLKAQRSQAMNKAKPKN